MNRKRDSEGLTRRQRFWLEHLSQARERGQSLVSYAQEHNLNLKSLYRHVRLSRERGEGKPSPVEGSRFVRVSAPAPTLCRVHLPNGCTVEWQGNADEEALSGWLRAASRLS